MLDTMDAPTPETLPEAPPTGPGANPLDQVVPTFRARVASSKRYIRSYYSEMKRNIELRLGHPAGQTYTGGLGIEDEIRTEINPDWSLTKTKTANLYSQVPTVQVTHENKQYAAAVPGFAKALNYELGDKRANVGVAMEEVLNDVVNAAGIGAVIVGYAARFEQVMVPQQDPMAMMVAQATGQPPAPPTMVPVQRTVSDKFYATRISPKDILVPAEFVGSNFDDGDFVGRRGSLSWAEAKNEFKLKDSDKERVLSQEPERVETDLRSSPEQTAVADSPKVCFDDLYYWRYRVDPEEKSFKAIWRMVFVDGLETPVVHEPWKGQHYDPQARSYTGACKFPIRLLTLTYITDNSIPPSDSSAGRPQVNDLRRSRSQMFQNRERSIPVRWFDTNRVDIEVQNLLMKGVVQGWLPSNGDGTRSIGEIARASYPSEDFAFDRDTKADLMETWQIGPSQLGVIAPGERTKAEVENTQGNFSTRIGQERARVANFFLGITEVLAGLMALYSDFPVLSQPERRQMEQAWDSKKILHDLVFKTRPDSTIMLDSQSRMARLERFLSLTGKSGMINPLPIITEMCELTGLDPSEIVKPPQPPPPPQPDPPKLSINGKDDLINPMVIAMLIATNQAPTPEQIQQAKGLLLDAAGPVQPPPAQPAQPGITSPAGSGGPGAAPPHVMADQHPDWGLVPKISKRSRDIGTGE